MATVEDTDARFRMTQEWKELLGLDRGDLAVYQSWRLRPASLKQGKTGNWPPLGNGMVAGPLAVKADDAWLVQAPVVVLDDDSFMEYCRRLEHHHGLTELIVLNHIWDNLNSKFPLSQIYSLCG